MNNAPANTARAITIHHLGFPADSTTIDKNGLNAIGIKNSEVTMAAAVLLMPIRLNITKVTAMSITTTSPRMKQSSGHVAWKKCLVCCIFVRWNYSVFFPNSGSILMNADTATVTRHSTITMQKKVRYPTASFNTPAIMPGSISPR